VTVSGTGHKAKPGNASGKSSSNKGNTGAQQNYGRSGTPNSIIQEGHTVNPSASGNLNSGSSTNPASSGKASGISSSSSSGIIPPKFSRTESDAPNAEQASEKKQAKHTNGWLIAVIVIIAAGSVIIAYVLFKRKKAKQKLDETREIKLKK
jgi:ABC-type transport system involved in multi-copper enzyme maturation permease subunit